MKWYHAAIKRILHGIIFFLLPLILLLFVLGKAIDIVQKLILPIKKHLPAEQVLGVGMITLISILLILVICYIAGILAESRRIKSLIAKLEDNVLVFIPGYSMLKAQAGDAISEGDDKWQAVLMGEDNDWKMGIEVDRQPDGYCTVFFPEPPDAKSGAMKLVHASTLKKLDMPVSKLIKIIRKYGEGAATLMNNGK